MNTASNSTFWTEDRIRRICDLFARGWSAGRISDEIGGTSRSAVIGKLHRLGLTRRGNPRMAAIRKKSGPPKSKPSSPPPMPVARISPPPVQPGIATAIAVEITATRVGLLAAAPDQCRWPAADDGSATLVCGAAVRAGSWCAAHARRVFAPLRGIGPAASASEPDPPMRRTGRGPR
jgi:GcrA cell cycle regulator